VRAGWKRGFGAWGGSWKVQQCCQTLHVVGSPSPGPLTLSNALSPAFARLSPLSPLEVHLFFGFCFNWLAPGLEGVVILYSFLANYAPRPPRSLNIYSRRFVGVNFDVDFGPHVPRVQRASEITTWDCILLSRFVFSKCILPQFAALVWASISSRCHQPPGFPALSPVESSAPLQLHLHIAPGILVGCVCFSHFHKELTCDLSGKGVGAGLSTCNVVNAIFTRAQTVLVFTSL